MTFNLRQAWELAAPELLRLDLKIRQLLYRVHTEARSQIQNPDLSLPWPNDSLREAFEALSTEELARATNIIYFAGHWHPGTNDWLRPLTRTGTYWRFAAYADEILRLALGIRRGQSSKNTFHFEVSNGVLKACVGTHKMWMAYPVGYANQETLKHLKDILENETLDIVPNNSDAWFYHMMELVKGLCLSCSHLTDNFFQQCQTLTQ